MKFLNIMVRVKNLDESFDFYCTKLGFREVARKEFPEGRFTLIYLAAPGDEEPCLKFTYNWEPEEYPPGRNIGHLAFEVDDIYEICHNLIEKGVILNRPPKDGRMAFIKSPDNVAIELLQKGQPQKPKEPWVSMKNTGSL